VIECALDLREAIDLAVGPRILKAAGKGLTLRLDVDERVPARVVAHATLLDEVLETLVDHAIRATAAPGRIEVRVSTEPAKDDREGLLVTVEAMSHALPRLSVRGLRLIDAVIGRHGDPHLTALARLLGEHGGDLDTPEDGPGVLVHARLPLRPEDGGADDPVKGLLREGVRALIVGGGSQAARQLEDSLRALSVEAAIAPSGGKALLELRRAADADRPFDVVLVHPHLSDRLGSDLAMDIRREPRLGDPLVVMISEEDDRGDTLRIDRTRVLVTLRRPVERQALLGVLVASQGINRARQVRQRRRRSEARPRILFAGSSPLRGRSLPSLLEAHGYEVTAAEDAETALDLVSRQSFALVVVESGPAATGAALCRTLRERGEVLGAHLPAVAITGIASAADAARLIAAGADGLLPRGGSAELLLAAVEAWCGDVA
jgi:CheY-like chemotaxis protein